jgi:membrane protein YdbS with pleckstrin-like domain
VIASLMGRLSMEADEKACPVCGETIKAAAIKCRFCNTDLQAFTAQKEQETEKTLFSGHPAALYTARQVLPFLLLALAIAGGYFARDANDGILIAIAAFVVLSGIVWLSFFLKRLGTHYTITTQRIILERGVLSKVQESLELFRIDHFEIDKPLGMRLMGQCALRIFTSDAELERFSIYGVPGLEALANTLRECQLRERSRRNLTTFVKA